jgi:hypothetical protein
MGTMLCMEIIRIMGLETEFVLIKIPSLLFIM